MALLNISQQYIVNGGEFPSRDSGKRPGVIHLRLSSELLSQLLNEENVEVSIANVASSEPVSECVRSGRSMSISFTDNEPSGKVITINDVQHALQRSVEASPHHLFRLGSSSRNTSLQQLELIGNIQAKFAVRQNTSLTTSASQKLKERREEEAARKSEHRAVLLSSAPVPSSKKKPASTSLKLRAKGLAPSSPLIRSRAGTPAESHSISIVEKDQTEKTSSPLKREGSPTGLRQALVQLLAAKGPMTKREIVQSVQYGETQVMALLPRVAHAPEQVQSKKFAGPVNRRSNGNLSGGNSTSSTEDNIVFVLKDSAWQEVLIKDWEGFDAQERIRLSETMERMLDSLKVAKSADCRLQIVRDRAVRAKEEPAAPAEEATKVVQPSSSSKKPTTKERLARAAKGKALKASTHSSSSGKATPSTAAKRVTSQEATPSKDAKASLSTSAVKKVKRNVSLEYTDSEDEDKGAVVKPAEVRQRHGVGKGANLVKEPWLDVRSIREWHELAKRFRRTYGDYQANLGRVQEEEVKLRSEIEQARIEEQHQLQKQQQPQRRNSVRAVRTSRSSDAKADTSPSVDDEKEEGEADPVEPTSTEPFSWRTAKVSGGEPMPLEEMDALVTTVLELEGQLRRMKNALQDSKKFLV